MVMIITVRNNKKLCFFSNILYKKYVTKSPVKYSHDSIFCCHSEITNQSQLHSTSDCMPLYCPNNWLAQFQSGRALKTWREREIIKHGGTMDGGGGSGFA